MRTRRFTVTALAFMGALVAPFADILPQAAAAEANAVSQPPISQAAAARRAAQLAGRHHANAQDVAYVVVNANVEIFPLAQLIANANPAPLKTITGFISPTSVAVDAHGDFFVCDTLANTVYGFKPGAIQPYVRYDRGLTNPYAVAIGNDGTLYVINDPAKGPLVLEFALGKHAPTRTLHGIPGQPGSLALDGQNNLYVAYMVSEGVGGVETFAPGATSGTNLNLVAMPQPSGIVVDSSGDIVVSGFLTVPVGPSQSRALPSIAFYLAGLTQPTFPTGAPLFPGAMALTADESTIFIADSQDSVLTFQYGPSADFAPLGLLPFAGGNADVRGIAVSPPDPT